MANNILITGATGFVGHQLVIGLLKRDPNADLHLLIRPNRQQSAQARLQDLIADTAKETGIAAKTLHERLHAIEGDIEQPRFGMTEATFVNLAKSLQTIFHSAASVIFDLPLEKARQLNVNGTKTAVELATLAQQKGDFKRLNHISTAYVAGKREGVIYESELDCGQEFNNSYEQVKWEAETFLQKQIGKLPLTIFRPSIIMGNSKTGWTNSFNVLYAPLKWGYFGKLPFAPGGRKSKLDCVPIDFISQAILYLSGLNQEVIGKVFHLTVGQGRTISVAELIDQSQKHLIALVDEYGLKNPKRVPKMIHPLLLKALLELAIAFAPEDKKRLFRNLKTYSAYTLFYKEFNNDEARKLLAPAGIAPPALSEYLPILCRYCVQTHFGTSDRPRDVL